MRWLVQGVIALVSFLVAAGASELLLRAIGYQYSPLKIGAGLDQDWRDEHAFGDRHLVYDPVLIWRPQSGQFSPFNPQGFRGAPIEPRKPAGTYRIIALGDSNTFGWAVDDGANWPSQLQGRVAASHRGAEVVNAGVWGYSSFQGLRRFHEILAFDPDLVLVSFGANDAHPVRVPDASYVERHEHLQRLTWATRRVRLAQLAVATWDRVEMATGADEALVPRVSVGEYRAHLDEMIRTARERGVQVVLLTRVFIGSSSDPSSWKTHAPAYNAATLDVARQAGVPVVDLQAAFHHRPDLFDDESHFGVEGHRVAAALIYEQIIPLLRR